MAESGDKHDEFILANSETGKAIEAILSKHGVVSSNEMLEELVELVYDETNLAASVTMESFRFG